MIVRDESRVLARCLDAARPILDAACICDTGSRDGTAGIASRWLAAHGIPGEVRRHAFRDFGHNRTLALRAAQRMLGAMGWDRRRAYLLLLDADMVLQIAPSFRPEALTADLYRVLQSGGGYLYPNVRLARASLRARFVGATHEHFQAPPRARQETLETLTIDDRADGGHRARKFERDRRLLTLETRRRPRNARAVFYLAQTHRDLGDDRRALSWYRRRIALGGWAEEIWYSHYAIGLIHLRRGEIRPALASLHRALRLDPSRAEPYFHLARHLGAQGRPLAAARLALRGARLPLPANRALFLEEEVYRWGLLAELARWAFLTRLREEGLAANERLALSAGSPPEASALASAHAALYARPLPGAAYTEIAPRLPRGFLPCNPSIARTREGYLAVCRAVSYAVDEEQRYHPLRKDGSLETRNFLLRLNQSLRVRGQRELRAEIPPLRRSRVRGLEDLRIVRRGTALAATCTTMDLHPEGPVRMSLVEFGRDRKLRRHAPLSGYGDGAPQKNWLPFTDPGSGELRAIYAYRPFVVLRIDPKSGRCAPAVERREPRPLGSFRGSAGPVALPATRGGGRLVLVHDVSFHGIRYYLHRFLLYDDAWRLRRASRPFFFHHRGIEFAGGACIAHGGKDLLITLGVEDREAWICRIPLERVLAMLRPLPRALPAGRP